MVKTLLFLSLFALIVSVYCANIRFTVPTPTACKDGYIWIADGSVSCTALVKETFWGLHKDPGHWCNHYALADCCATCWRLREGGVIE